jgi:hypothetical protein
MAIIPSDVIFPVHVVRLKTKDLYRLPNLRELERYVEFYDSSSPSDSAEIRVLDDRGRRLNLVVYRLETTSISLESQVANEEDRHILETYKRLN